MLSGLESAGGDKAFEGRSDALFRDAGGVGVGDGAVPGAAFDGELHDDVGDGPLMLEAALDDVGFTGTDDEDDDEADDGDEHLRVGQEEADGGAGDGDGGEDSPGGFSAGPKVVPRAAVEALLEVTVGACKGFTVRGLTHGPTIAPRSTWMFQVVWPAVNTSYPGKPMLAAMIALHLSVTGTMLVVMRFAPGSPETRLAAAVATSFQIFVLWAVVVVLRGTAWVREQAAKAIPQITPMYSTADTWVRPEQEDGDRLLEADVFGDDHETRRLVLLLKKDGRLFGFDGPLDGDHIHFVMGGDEPPEPE